MADRGRKRRQEARRALLCSGPRWPGIEPGQSARPRMRRATSWTTFNEVLVDDFEARRLAPARVVRSRRTAAAPHRSRDSSGTLRGASAASVVRGAPLAAEPELARAVRAAPPARRAARPSAARACARRPPTRPATTVAERATHAYRGARARRPARRPPPRTVPKLRARGAQRPSSAPRAPAHEPAGQVGRPRPSAPRRTRPSGTRGQELGARRRMSRQHAPRRRRSLRRDARDAARLRLVADVAVPEPAVVADAPREELAAPVSASVCAPPHATATTGLDGCERLSARARGLALGDVAARHVEPPPPPPAPAAAPRAAAASRSTTRHRLNAFAIAPRPPDDLEGGSLLLPLRRAPRRERARARARVAKSSTRKRGGGDMFFRGERERARARSRARARRARGCCSLLLRVAETLGTSSTRLALTKPHCSTRPRASTATVCASPIATPSTCGAGGATVGAKASSRGRSSSSTPPWPIF